MWLTTISPRCYWLPTQEFAQECSWLKFKVVTLTNEAQPSQQLEQRGF